MLGWLMWRSAKGWQVWPAVLRQATPITLLGIEVRSETASVLPKATAASVCQLANVCAAEAE
jgi:hypothetical protein